MEPENFKDQKVFIVDDNEMTALLYEQFIRNLGFEEVTTFNDGMSCLNALIDEPKIIFLDHEMGTMDGLEILKKITACVKGATQKKSVQSQPHLVLLDKTWYNTSLSPLLAEWTELWLRARGASRGIAEHHMRAYLTCSGNVAGTFCVSQIQRLFQAPL